VKRVGEYSLNVDSIGGFFQERPDIPAKIDADFPTLRNKPFAAGIVQGLFWPRNRVLHTGKTDWTEKESLSCYNIAQLGLYVLHELDEYGTLKPWP